MEDLFKVELSGFGNDLDVEVKGGEKFRLISRFLSSATCWMEMFTELGKNSMRRTWVGYLNI